MKLADRLVSTSGSYPVRVSPSRLKRTTQLQLFAELTRLAESRPNSPPARTDFSHPKGGRCGQWTPHIVGSPVDVYTGDVVPLVPFVCPWCYLKPRVGVPLVNTPRTAEETRLPIPVQFITKVLFCSHKRVPTAERLQCY